MARRKAAGTDPIPVDAIRQKDSRKNIPTEELRDFVREDEETPRTMLYPRNPSHRRLTRTAREEAGRNAA